MLNPNTRTNTVISQSFIASEFQGYNDPFVRSQPTSSLNQFMKSKQTSDSGIFQQESMNQQGQQSFGFSNITGKQEVKPVESFGRKVNDNVQANVIPQRQQMTGYNNQAYQQPQNVQNQQQFIPQNQQQFTPQQQQFIPQNQQQQFIPQQNQSQQQQQFSNQQFQQQVNKVIPPQQQQNLQQRYITPQITKTDSPTKNNPTLYQQQQQQNIPQQQQQTKPYSQTPADPLVNSRPINLTPSTVQQPKTQSTPQQQQKSQKLLQGSRASTQLTGEGSTIGKKLKLNVSQEFSNSFVLKCVNQPQKSTILQMKQRQRQYRKSIQNFFI